MRSQATFGNEGNVHQAGLEGTSIPEAPGEIVIVPIVQVDMTRDDREVPQEAGARPWWRIVVLLLLVIHELHSLVVLMYELLRDILTVTIQAPFIRRGTQLIRLGLPYCRDTLEPCLLVDWIPATDFYLVLEEKTPNSLKSQAWPLQYLSSSCL